MQEVGDTELLRQYVRENSDQAFAALVARHVNMVYSAALRKTGNPAAAEEITQAVFIILAKKADQLSRHTALSGWLYQAARLTAANFLRTEIRRARREQEASMQSSQTESEIWPQITSLLEDAMGYLGEKDRNAIVLRFFDGNSFLEIGAAFGASENAAKKRVAYALEKLRKYLSKHGVISSTAVLAGAISANSVQAAPAALAKSVTAAAIAKGAAASTSTLTLIKGALKFMAWTHAKTVIVSAAVIGLAAYSVVQHQAQARLREQNESLQRQMAQLRADNELLVVKRALIPRMPAPPFQVATLVETNAMAMETTNLYSRLYDRLKDRPVKLTREQVDTYLGANGRNASTLLAAFRTSGDPALLKEAIEKYPNDPQVAFEAVAYDIMHSKDASPDEQRKRLDAFEKSAPDNALANYLSALNYFNAGQIDRGVQDLAAASTKSLNDYTVSRGENDMEAYLAAGYPMADAEVLGTSQLLLPHLAQLKQLALDSADLANAYRQSGDTESAQTVLQMADKLGQQYATPSAGEPTITQLVGIAIERIALRAMDPNTAYGDNGQTAQDRLAQLMQQRTNVQQMNDQAQKLLPELSDQDWIIYKNRWLMFGEENAETWVVGKYAHQ